MPQGPCWINKHIPSGQNHIVANIANVIANITQVVTDITHVVVNKASKEAKRAWQQSNLAMTKAKQFYMNPGWSQSWTSCKEWISKGASKHPVTYQIIPTLRTIIVTKSFNFLIFSHFTSIKYSESSETIRNILVQILCMTIFQHQKSIWIHWHYSVQLQFEL